MCALNTLSIDEQFKEWLKDHAHELSVEYDESTLVRAKFESFVPLNDMIGKAQVVAIGEPIHGGHEPLVMRNFLIQYLITELGFNTIAFESGLSPSKRLYDYVMMHSDQTDSALTESFSYGFGKFHENLDLLHWLREFNAGQPPPKRVRLYGIDLPGSGYPYAYLSLEAVLSYIDGVDRALARDLRADLASVVENFRVDKFIELSKAEQSQMAVQVDDLITLIRRRRVDFTAASSWDEYDWALRQALNAAQDVAFMRLSTPEMLKLWRGGQDSLPKAEEMLTVLEVREVAMVDNLAWVMERGGGGRRLIYFAHNFHLQGHPGLVPPGQGYFTLLNGFHSSGMHLRSFLREDLFVIGTAFGRGIGFSSKPQLLEPVGFDATLSSLGLAAYAIDLRTLKVGTPVADWCSTEHLARIGPFTVNIRPKQAYDAVLYIDRITPAKC